MQQHRVLVTGGTGAVGRNLVPALVEAGTDVRVLQHKTPVPDTGVEVVTGDIRRPRAEWFDGIDVVYHLAAHTVPAGANGAVKDVNARGARELVRVLDGLETPPRLVFTSSIAVFGPCRDNAPATSDSALHPVTDYGRAKAEAEAAVREYDRAVIVRLPMVVGSGDRVTPRFEKLARVGLFPVTRKRFSAMDVRDAVRLFLHLAHAPDVEGRTFTVSDGAFYSWSDVARHFAKKQRRRVHTAPIPRFLLNPRLFALLGNADGALYLRHDWICLPDFPGGFEIPNRVFQGGSP